MTFGDWHLGFTRRKDSTVGLLLNLPTPLNIRRTAQQIPYRECQNQGLIIVRQFWNVEISLWLVAAQYLELPVYMKVWKTNGKCIPSHAKERNHCVVIKRSNREEEVAILGEATTDPVMIFSVEDNCWRTGTRDFTYFTDYRNNVFLFCRQFDPLKIPIIQV